LLPSCSLSCEAEGPRKIEKIHEVKILTILKRRRGRKAEKDREDSRSEDSYYLDKVRNGDFAKRRLELS
ncbi:MAG: hypothetical protein J6R71_00590, partial [Bacteroidales bacterium]|nr:hypothetical protein [Bacteroidales bacterium]